MLQFKTIQELQLNFLWRFRWNFDKRQEPSRENRSNFLNRSVYIGAEQNSDKSNDDQIINFLSSYRVTKSTLLLVKFILGTLG